MRFKGLVRYLRWVILIGGFSCQSPDGTDDPIETGAARGFGEVPAEAGKSSYYKPIPEPAGPIALGFGVDLNNQTGIPNVCVVGEEKVVPQHEGVFFLDANFSRSEVDRYLGGSAKGGLSFGKWGMSSRGSFSHKLNETRYGLNYIAIAYVKSHSKVFVPTARTEATANLGSEEWLRRCGTGYVAAQDYGSLLVIKISLKLENKTVTSNFKTSSSGQFLSFAKLKASLSANGSKNRDRGTLSISALQLGGKPEELGKLLKAPDQKDSLISGFSLCNVEKAKDCLEKLSSIENYLADVFPKQLKKGESGGPRVLRTYPFEYPGLLGSDYNPGLDEFVIKARSDLANLYSEEMNDIAVLNQIDGSAADQWEEVLVKARSNVAGIRQSTQLCYDPATYQQCARRAEELAIACSETNVPSTMLPEETSNQNTGSSSGE